MRPAAAVLLAAACAAVASWSGAGAAEAGAWARNRGKAQIILKHEVMRARKGYDPAGEIMPLLAERRDEATGIHAEYGLTDRLTFQFKGDWQAGSDAFVDYEGRGPIELGLTWQAWRSADTAVSLYGGIADGGEGRNAGYAPPGVGDRDAELRLSVGRSLALAPLPGVEVRAFVEGQAARRFRDGLSDETRIDMTLGGHLGEDWLLLVQGFGGAADEGARWLSVEASAVRDFGDWSLQAGWRRTVAGRETPLAEGPVIALWRRF